MQRKLLGFMVTVSVFAMSLGGAEAQTHTLRHAGRHACEQLVTVKHPQLKGAARDAEIAKCNADAEAYNR